MKMQHDQGVVHGHLSASSVLILDKELNIEIADLEGQATVVGENGSNARSEDPSYVAPEVLAEAREPGHERAVDVWSLGVLLYVCLCGYTPFSRPMTSNLFPLTLEEQIERGEFRYPSPQWDSVGDLACKVSQDSQCSHALTSY